MAALGVVAVLAGGLLGSFGALGLVVAPQPALVAQVLCSVGLAAVGWLLCVRPKLLVSDFGVAVVNPLRTTFVRWVDLDACGADERVWIRTTDGQLLEVYALRTDPDRRDRDVERLLGTLRRRGRRARRAAAAPARRPRLPAV